MVKTVTFGSAIFLTVTNLEGSSQNCSYLFENGRGKNCPKMFLGSPLKTKTMAINFGILKLISYSYCKSHCITKYGFTVLLLKKIILSRWRHQSLSNVIVDLSKNDVMLQ